MVGGKRGLEDDLFPKKSSPPALIPVYEGFPFCENIKGEHNESISCEKFSFSNLRKEGGNYVVAGARYFCSVGLRRWVRFAAASEIDFRKIRIFEGGRGKGGESGASLIIFLSKSNGESQTVRGFKWGVFRVIAF